MINIENINIWLTIFSVICTIVSIVFSIISICNARKAKKYKEQVYDVLNTVDIIEVTKNFENVATTFISNTRAEDWYKGKDPENIMKPLITILVKLPSLYELIEESDKLKNSVKTLNNYLIEYEKADTKIKRSTNSLILKIQEILQNAVKKQLNKL